jgi:hypothetical protein
LVMEFSSAYRDGLFYVDMKGVSEHYIKVR